jgi:hypothetical protein
MATLKFASNELQVLKDETDGQSAFEIVAYPTPDASVTLATVFLNEACLAATQLALTFEMSFDTSVPCQFAFGVVPSQAGVSYLSHEYKSEKNGFISATFPVVLTRDIDYNVEGGGFEVQLVAPLGRQLLLTTDSNVPLRCSYSISTLP